MTVGDLMDILKTHDEASEVHVEVPCLTGGYVALALCDEESGVSVSGDGGWCVLMLEDDRIRYVDDDDHPPEFP